MEIHDVLAGLAILVGLLGIVLVFLPGLAIQVAAVAIWAFEESTVGGWVVLGLVAITAITATILKYAFPGRRLREDGIPAWLLFTAVAVAIAGIFVIPIVGAPIGFVATIYLFERARKGSARAWPSTKAALKAVLTSTGIELAGGFLITTIFLVATIVL